MRTDGRDAVWRSCSARRRVLHARLQPALGDCEDSRGFARGKGSVKAEHSTVAAVALRALDRDGGAEAATVGLVCRGRNDVLAHGNGGIWNRVQSATQAGMDLHEHGETG